MTVVRLDVNTAPAPGDIRSLGRGVLVELAESVRDRDDWPSLLCALPVAVGRGASVVWVVS